MHFIWSKGLIVLLVGSIGGVFIGVSVCMFFFHQSLMGQRRVSPETAPTPVPVTLIKRGWDYYSNPSVNSFKSINGKLDTARTSSPVTVSTVDTILPQTHHRTIATTHSNSVRRAIPEPIVTLAKCESPTDSDLEVITVIERNFSPEAEEQEEYYEQEPLPDDNASNITDENESVVEQSETLDDIENQITPEEENSEPSSVEIVEHESVTIQENIDDTIITVEDPEITEEISKNIEENNIMIEEENEIVPDANVEIPEVTLEDGSSDTSVPVSIQCERIYNLEINDISEVTEYDSNNTEILVEETITTIENNNTATETESEDVENPTVEIIQNNLIEYTAKQETLL